MPYQTPTQALTPPTWHSRMDGDLYVDSTGCIIGRVNDGIGSGCGYSAERGGNHLGMYIDRLSARRAVEVAGGIAE